MRRRKGSLIVQAPTHFSTVVIDPPWPERGAGKIKRGADRHYPLLALPKIPPVILNSGVFRMTDNAHMYMWATSNYLMKAGWVIEQLGFRYVACIPWVKSGKKAGLGQYFRGKAEYLLFAVKGKGFEVRTEDRYVVGLIEAARREHSRKPEEAYDLIERRSKGPFLEIFARVDGDHPARPGWTTWGNHVDDVEGSILADPPPSGTLPAGNLGPTPVEDTLGTTT